MYTNILLIYKLTKEKRNSWKKRGEFSYSNANLIKKTLIIIKIIIVILLDGYSDSKYIQ